MSSPTDSISSTGTGFQGFRGVQGVQGAHNARGVQGVRSILSVVDPTNHGSNLGVVAALAVGILVLIGLLVFLLTRRGRGRPRRR